jgi:spore coat-associated protein N
LRQWIAARKGPTLKFSLLALAAAPLLLVCALTPTSSGASVDGRPVVSNLTLALGTAARPLPAADSLAPGDSVQEMFDLNLSAHPTRNTKVAVVISTVGRSSILDSDARNGLRVTVERCTALNGLLPGRGVLGCGGFTRLIANAPVAQLRTRTLVLPGLVVGVPVYLWITVNLPSSAGNTFENRRTTLRFTFAAHV